MLKSSKGFTLLELLIVIAIVVILVGVAITAINPARQFAQANDARRWTDISSILNGISQNIVDNRGVWDGTDCEGDLPTTSTCMADHGKATTTDCPTYYDIAGCLVPTYLPEMPVDPARGVWVSTTDYNTYYKVYHSTTTGRVTVNAPAAQLEEISLTR